MLKRYNIKWHNTANCKALINLVDEIIPYNHCLIVKFKDDHKTEFKFRGEKRYITFSLSDGDRLQNYICTFYNFKECANTRIGSLDYKYISFNGEVKLLK